MNRIYNPGDIVFFRNVMFHDADGEDRLDIRMAGHPFLVLNCVNDFGDKCYALKLTSRALDYVDQYLLSKTSAMPNLRKDSYVNLNKVFEFDIDKRIVPVCHLKRDHLSQIYQRTYHLAY